MSEHKLGNLNTAIKASYETHPTDPDKTVHLVKIVAVESGALPWEKFEVTIPASGTTVIDTNLLTSFSRIDYILNFKDDPITVTKSLKMVVQNDAGVLTDSISERMGGAINIKVSATDDGIDQFLEIENNESFDLDVTYLKAKI